ncbi:MAG: AMP-binding protein [Clostridia bacterium]|nr:AMP-binding protein [Clostridia bacterium]
MAKKIKYNEVVRIDSIRDMMDKAVAAMGDQTLFKYKKAGKVQEVGCKEFNDTIIYLGNALAKRGFAENCHIACVGANSYPWIVTYLSTLCGSNVFVPIDKDLPEKDLLNVVEHSESVVIFCDKSLVPLFTSDAKELARVKLVVCLDGDDAVPFESLLAEGKALSEKGYTAYTEKTTPDMDLKMLVYTSGTTGNSKGVMLSHHNIRSALNYGLMVEDVKVRCLSVLPYHHTYESVIGILVSIHKHNCICINESLRAVLPNIQLYKPVYIFVVPAFAELFYKRVWATLEEKGKAGLVRKMIKLSNGLRKIGIDLRRKFFKQIIDNFGGELRQIICGGAPVRPEIGEFFTNIGIDLENGYGITECSPLVSVNQGHDNDFASVGVVLPCLEINIDQKDENGNGEICVKGDVVMMGYFKDKAQTDEVLVDGWFHTGDLGNYTNGKLYITGRKKNLIVLDNGKNIYPEEIENYIYSIPYVKDAVVYSIKDENGAETDLCAEGFLDMDLLPADGRKPEEIFKADILALTKDLPSYKHIHKVVIRDTDFPKTTTKKIKRNDIKK